MKVILVTCRVDDVTAYSEQRDAVDKNWVRLLLHCNIFPVFVPNSMAWLNIYLKNQVFDGVIFTGGNDLVCCGGTSQERDDVESYLLKYCLENKKPVLGVCRGMQLLASYFGAQLVPVNNQIKQSQMINYKGKLENVNSFHRYEIAKLPICFDTLATTEDEKHIKAIAHQTEQLTGIMWHPERMIPFSSFNTSIIKSVFYD